MASKLHHPFRLRPAVCALLTTVLPSPTMAASEGIIFNRDIRPILSQNCFACHGPDASKREADLRLDLPTGALSGGESGKPAIIPGKPNASTMWERISSSEPDEVMPPPEFHHDLTTAQKETIRLWITQGARYQEHWAFIPPARNSPPAIVEFENPIDRFVAARLRKEGLAFSPAAAPNLLIRRLAFDITGLPPSPEVLTSKPASAIDTLLASPHFGERMALPWLDAARYADTNGYSIDGGRHAWLWRDWVIRSFNSNMPYDQFLIEQLAGDLFDKPSEAQRIATAYNRNHSITHEGGTIPAENLNNYLADRVKTVGESILGLTTACAQCHDHKYDPFTQKDYYRLYAFFNSVSDKGLDGNGGNNSRPSIQASSPLTSPEEIRSVREQIAAAQNALHQPEPKEQAKWEADILAKESLRGVGFQTIPLRHLSATLPNGNPEQLKVDTSGEFVTVSSGNFSAYNICCEIPPNSPPIAGLRVHFEPGAKGNIGYGKDGNFVLNTLSPSLSPYPAKNIDHNSLIPAARVTASSHRATFEPSLIHDTRPRNGWSPSITTNSQHITYTFPNPLDVSTLRYLTTELVFNYGGSSSPERFRIELFTGHDPDSEYSSETLALLRISPEQRTSKQLTELKSRFERHSKVKANLRYKLANLGSRLKVLTEKHPVMVMDTAASPRATHILERGVYSAPLEEVSPGTPGFLPPLLPAGQNGPGAPTRLDLARWLTRPDHPLTARVAVNNLWAIFFGKGLVTTRADFGSQGSWPSHPDLLDWLAIHFQDSGWNVKELITLIVSSKTYQQSSHSDSIQLNQDPANELLARGARFRLPAEHIRDQALAISGLLVPWLGGPSVNPYQPGDLWRQVSHYGSTPATAQTFVQGHGKELYRRSLYTYWKRTLPPPSMAAFDAPNREICTVGRGVTNTPLQAFVLLNDPQFVEASRAFAARLLLENHSSERHRLIAAFREVTSRSPDSSEIRTLSESLQRELELYKRDPGAARRLLSLGESVSPKLPPVRHAAWTNVCQLLLNLSEAITRH